VLGQARASLGGSAQLLCYLAVPPVAFVGLTQALGQYGMARGARVVYEKPFGDSAAKLPRTGPGRSCRPG
jgi:glucose-6-phosphate 1-dehydrogenase